MSSSCSTPSGGDADVDVTVIAGGFSLEREVSLRSGQRVAEALEAVGHRVRRLDVDDTLLDHLSDDPCDVAYLALHGRTGEDGTIQGLLDLMGVPYTGSGAIASALTWDKHHVKAAWERAGIATPAWLVLSADAVRDVGARRVLPRIVERHGLPLIVKPAQGGAALGVGYVETPDELTGALVAAFRHHPLALIERFVEGTEVAVSIVGDTVLPPVGISPRTARYDFAARYTPGATDFDAPAKLPDDVLARCAHVAREAARLAGARDVLRADMIVDGDGRPQLLEVDTCPGMTATSLLPLAAAAHGWSFEHVCDHVVRLAAERAGAGTG